jgi:hypothetical protein
MRLRIRDIRVDRFSQLSRSEQRRWLEVPEMPKLSPSVKNGDTCQESMKIEHCALKFNLFLSLSLSLSLLLRLLC